MREPAGLGRTGSGIPRSILHPVRSIEKLLVRPQRVVLDGLPGCGPVKRSYRSWSACTIPRSEIVACEGRPNLEVSPRSRDTTSRPSTPGTSWRLVGDPAVQPPRLSVRLTTRRCRVWTLPLGCSLRAISEQRASWGFYGGQPVGGQMTVWSIHCVLTLTTTTSPPRLKPQPGICKIRESARYAEED